MNNRDNQIIKKLEELNEIIKKEIDNKKKLFFKKKNYLILIII